MRIVDLDPISSRMTTNEIIPFPVSKQIFLPVESFSHGSGIVVDANQSISSIWYKPGKESQNAGVSHFIYQNLISRFAVFQLPFLALKEHYIGKTENVALNRYEVTNHFFSSVNNVEPARLCYKPGDCLVIKQRSTSDVWLSPDLLRINLWGDKEGVEPVTIETCTSLALGGHANLTRRLRRSGFNKLILVAEGTSRIEPWVNSIALEGMMPPKARSRSYEIFMPEIYFVRDSANLRIGANPNAKLLEENPKIREKVGIFYKGKWYSSPEDVLITEPEITTLKTEYVSMPKDFIANAKIIIQCMPGQVQDLATIYVMKYRSEHIMFLERGTDLGVMEGTRVVLKTQGPHPFDENRLQELPEFLRSSVICDENKQRIEGEETIKSDHEYTALLALAKLYKLDSVANKGKKKAVSIEVI